MTDAPLITRLVLVRHGEAECNVAGIFGGPLGCTGLSDAGRQQVEQLRDRLARTGELADASVLYASTLPRAVETAEILNGILGGLPLATDHGLCELHPGVADGMSFTDYAEKFYKEGSARWVEDTTVPAAPGGESWAGFVARATGALIAITDAHPGATIVVACHGGVIDASMIRFLGIDGPYRAARFRTTNASLTEWIRVGDRWRLIRYNDAAHLLAPPP